MKQKFIPFYSTQRTTKMAAVGLSCFFVEFLYSTSLFRACPQTFHQENAGEKIEMSRPPAQFLSTVIKDSPVVFSPLNILSIVTFFASSRSTR